MGSRLTSESVLIVPVEADCALWPRYLQHVAGARDGSGSDWLRKRRTFHLAAVSAQGEVLGHVALAAQTLVSDSLAPESDGVGEAPLEEVRVLSHSATADERGPGIAAQLRDQALELARSLLCYQLAGWPGESAPPLKTGILPGDPRLPNHTMTLGGDPVCLRPLAEDDWPLFDEWERDPEVRFWSERDRQETSRAEERRAETRRMAANGHAFIIESPAGTPVGEFHVRHNDIPRCFVPGRRVIRLWIGIGDKSRWGQGIGRRAVRLGLEFAFESLGADTVCVPGVTSKNARAVNLWQSAGFSIVYLTADLTGRYGHDARSIDFAIDRREWRD